MKRCQLKDHFELLIVRQDFDVKDVAAVFDRYFANQLGSSVRKDDMHLIALSGFNTARAGMGVQFKCNSCEFFVFTYSDVFQDGCRAKTRT